MGAVGSADFVQAHAGAGHDVGDAEGAADFDQLTTRDDAFLARAEAVEGQQHGSGIVVDHGHRFSAGQFADQAFNQIVTITAFAAGQIELEIERIACGHLHRFDGFLGQQGATEIGVQHRAGQVEYPAYLTALLLRQAFADAAGEHFGADFHRRQLPAQHAGPQLIEQLTQARQQRIPAITLGQRRARRVTQQAINGWQPQGNAGRHQPLLISLKQSLLGASLLPKGFQKCRRTAGASLLAKAVSQSMWMWLT